MKNLFVISDSHYGYLTQLHFIHTTSYHVHVYTMTVFGYGGEISFLQIAKDSG